MVNAPSRQSGYVALLAVLVLGAAALAISFTMLLTGADSQRLTLSSQRAVQARDLARYCAEEAMLQVRDNVAYTTSSSGVTINAGQGSCTYHVTVQSPTTRTIRSKATVGSVVRKTQVLATVNATTITATSWINEDDNYSTISAVQHIANTVDASATTITATMRGAVTAGNAIIVAVTWDSVSTTTVTCTDNIGNTYTNINVWNDATATQAVTICYTANSAAGTPTITATLGASSATRRIVATEYSGMVTSSPVDVFGANVGGTGTTSANGVTSNNITPTKSGDLIYGVTMNGVGVATVTPGTGFTQRGYANLKDLVVQDFQQMTPAAVASTMTYGTANRYTAIAVAFRAATN